MMWVWQAEERARDIAKQRGLQGPEFDQFVQKRVTEANEQVLPKRLADTPAGAIELDGAGLLPFPNFQKYYFGKLSDELAKPYTPIYNESRPDRTGTRIFEAALDPQHPDHDRAVRALQEFVKWEPWLPYDLQAPIAQGKKDLSALGRDGRYQTSGRQAAGGGVLLTPDERKRIGDAVTKGVEQAFKSQEERAEKMRKALEARKDEIQKHGREAAIWQTLTNDEKAALYNDGFRNNQLMLGAVGGIARLAGDPQFAKKIDGAIKVNSALNDVITTSLAKSFAEKPGALRQRLCWIGRCLKAK